MTESRALPGEHFIPGKDASLEATIARMQDALLAAGFHVEERSWLNPVEDVWSVHVSDRDCPLLYTNGKGASQLAARASALGEFCERLACNYFWTHHFLGDAFADAEFTHHPDERWFPLGDDESWPTELLTPGLQSFYNPERNVPASALVDHNSGNLERGICALPFTRMADGVRVWFPVNVIGNLYVSNGMAAGNSREEARAQALSEIVERHVKFRVIGEGLCLPDASPDVLARSPGVAAGIAALRAAGFGIRVKDASLGGRFPVMAVALLNPKDQGCYVSFGAHPRSSIALERALTELLQGRALDALDGFPEPGFDLDEIGSTTNLESHFVDSCGTIAWRFLSGRADFVAHDWDFSSTTADDCAWLVDLIHGEDKDIYVADYTQLGVYACRIIVPGVSEIYPVDDLEFENNSFGNQIRDAILDLHELDEEECGELLDALNEQGLADERPVAALIGLAADPGTFWDDLRVGELKTLLALAAGDEAATREGCDWLRHFAQLAPERLIVYRCVATLLELFDSGEDELAYRQALAELYGEPALKRAEAHLMRAERFFGMTGPGRDFAGSAAHRRLLEAYGKARRTLAGG